MGALALFASSAFGVVATTSTTTPNPEDFDFSFVGQMNGSSAVAIGPHTVLTAGHVGGTSGDFILDGTTYHRTGSRFAPNYNYGIGGVTHTDLEVVFVNETLPGYYQIGDSISTGDTVTMVGFGRSGVVSGSGYNMNVDAGVRRKGDNTADEFGVIDAEDGNGFIGGPMMVSYLKQAGDAALGGSDSGGGWFSGGKLVGISSFIFNLTQSGTETAPKYFGYGFASQNTTGYTAQDGSYTLAPGTPYFGSGAIDLTDPQIHAFVTQAVPEPGTYLALGLGLVPFLKKRRSKKS